MTVSLCPHVLFNRRQPLAGFVDHDGTPTYYCATCLPERVEDALREGMTPQDIADAICFTNCNHIEDSGTCGRCAKGITAYLMYLSATLHLKPGKYELLTRLDRIITLLIGKYGRISPDNIRNHGKAL